MDSMFVHKHGVGAALRAVQQQVGAEYFASLQAEWERVLLECTDQRSVACGAVLHLPLCQLCPKRCCTLIFAAC